MDEPGAPDANPESSALRRRVEEALREPTLGPVWVVVVAHGVALLAPVMLMAARERNGLALGVLGLLLLASLSSVRTQFRSYHRLGPLHGLLVITWIASGLAAWGAHATGIY